MIDANNLTKRYGEKTAVDGLTFTVKPGIVTGFLGPNGSGKSIGAPISIAPASTANAQRVPRLNR